MLKLLLDEHISPDVANGLRRRNRAIEIRYMVEWEDGYFLGTGGFRLFARSRHPGLTLVTYDRRTIPPLLKPGRKKSERTGGVVFVDEKTISPADIGGLVLGLDQTGKRNWELGLDLIESISCGADASRLGCDRVETNLSGVRREARRSENR